MVSVRAPKGRVAFDNAGSCQGRLMSHEMAREPMAADNESSVRPVGIVS